jgi:transposase-like protein
MTPQQRAQYAVFVALGKGAIIKSSVCEKCNRSSSRIHGHHDDYSQPLTVRWMCSHCHSKWHAENGPAKGADLTSIAKHMSRSRSYRPPLKYIQALSKVS